MKTDTVKARKTSQKELDYAVRSFLYRYESLTGGTRDEVAKQAPRGIIGLTELADTVARLAANPNKIAAANAHLMDYALRLVPDRLALYRRNVPGTPEHAAKLAEISAQEAADKAELEGLLALDALTMPTNIIPFPQN
jgi:hypothetical protein